MKAQKTPVPEKGRVRLARGSTLIWLWCTLLSASRREQETS